MTRSEFTALLSKATTASIDFARRYVINDLSDAASFDVYLSRSCDVHATAKERLYPEDKGREYFCITEEEVVDVLYRDGRCPEWIDVSVKAQAPTHTRVRLICCGRFTDDLDLMYYSKRGMGPFGIKSPNLPFDFKEQNKLRLPRVL